MRDGQTSGRRRRRPGARLNRREHDVLRLLSSGLTNERIGARMHLAPSTVKGYVEQVLLKSKSVNRAVAAVFYADRHPLRGTPPVCALDDSDEEPREER